MKKLLATAATVVTLALAAPALAGYESPTFVSSSGTLAVDSPIANEFAASGDGLQAKRLFQPINNNDSGTLTFTIPDHWREDQTLVVYAYFDGTGTWDMTATYNDDGVPVGMSTATVTGIPFGVSVAIRIPAASFMPDANYLTGSRLLTGLQITYTYTGTNIASGNIVFDLVANPEPGSIALFGLGSLALGGFAWRRRKARKAAAAASV